jgi:predicted metal-binding protein
MAKEAYSYGKRGLFIWQKRPIHMAKEAYSYGKRGLFIWQKRPTNNGMPQQYE